MLMSIIIIKLLVNLIYMNWLFWLHAKDLYFKTDEYAARSSHEENIKIHKNWAPRSALVLTARPTFDFMIFVLFQSSNSNHIVYVT